SLHHGNDGQLVSDEQSLRRQTANPATHRERRSGLHLGNAGESGESKSAQRSAEWKRSREAAFALAELRRSAKELHLHRLNARRLRNHRLRALRGWADAAAARSAQFQFLESPLLSIV